MHTPESELWGKTNAYFKLIGVKVYRWILFGDGTEENYARINPFYYVPWETLKANGFLKIVRAGDVFSGTTVGTTALGSIVVEANADISATTNVGTSSVGTVTVVV